MVKLKRSRRVGICIHTGWEANHQVKNIHMYVHTDAYYTYVRRTAMGDAEDEDLSHESIEQQLEDHLQEHKLSLSALEEALACDPQNEELLEVSLSLSLSLSTFLFYCSLPPLFKR